MIYVNYILILLLFTSSLTNLYCWSTIEGEIDFDKREEDLVALTDLVVFILSFIFGCILLGYWFILISLAVIILLKIALYTNKNIVLRLYSRDKWGKRYYLYCSITTSINLILWFLFTN